jgi:hypothetical protein
MNPNDFIASIGASDTGKSIHNYHPQIVVGWMITTKQEQNEFPTQPTPLKQCLGKKRRLCLPGNHCYPKLCLNFMNVYMNGGCMYSEEEPY